MTSSWLHETQMSQPAPAGIPCQALSRAAGRPGTRLQAPYLRLIQKRSSFYILYFHSLDKGLPTPRVLFTCQKPPLAAKLPTMSFGGSACQRCLGRSCRGSAAKSWQL